VSIEQFVLADPSVPNLFRSIVLFGRNVASYKFALATALFEFAEQERDVIPVSELAEPYVLALCRHLKLAPKQGTSSQSKFLAECKKFNEGIISNDELFAVTARLGFQNVLDAFHRVGSADVPTRFFLDERKAAQPSIVITGEMLALAATEGLTAIQETESRWHLVETAWDLGLTTAVIAFDPDTNNLVLPIKRKVITPARPALNGYQKGYCFYCYRKIVITPGADDLADVDHLFPHALEKYGLAKNLDGIWNLVLACQPCNRGANGKFDATPAPKYVQRLHDRNEYLIWSHHPLRETLILQTGKTPESRRLFLQMNLDIASTYHPVPWDTLPLGNAAF
jgi:hypothetical protein